MRGSFPAPHHHDPNEMLPIFQIWVMVGSSSTEWFTGHLSSNYPLRDGVPRCRSGNGDNRKYFRRSALHFKAVISGCAGMGAACDSAGCSRMLVVLQRVPPLYGRRPGQPSSSSLARRACVHYSGCSSFYCMASLVFVPFKFVYWLFLKFASANGLSGGRGEMAMAVASSARLAFLRGAVCACGTPYIRHFSLFPVQ